MNKILCGHVFVALGYITRSGIAGSYDNSMFDIFENCQTVYQSGYTILHYHQQYVSVPVSPHPFQYLLLPVFFIIS